MGSELTCDGPVLAFDTSAAHCAVALRLEGHIFVLQEAMVRGQATRLFPLIKELLSAHDVQFNDLTRIGVGTGPGNFTGIRIAVSAARGLSLGLGIPAIGVSCLKALRGGAADQSAAIAAPRDKAYLQIGEAMPKLVNTAEVPPGTCWFETPDALVRSILELTIDAPLGEPPPAPFYLKAADAAPSSDVPPRILDDV